MFDLNEPASEPPPSQPPESGDGGGEVGIQPDSSAKIIEECRAEISSRQDWGLERPRSKSPPPSGFQMLFTIPKSPGDNGGGRSGSGDGGEELTLGGAAKNAKFCEFLQLKTNDEDVNTTTTTTTVTTFDTTVAHSDGKGSTLVVSTTSATSLHEEGQVEEEDHMCIDAFGQRGQQIHQEQPAEKEPQLDDSKFATIFWRGDINFQGMTVANLVAGCTREWQHVFKNRRVASNLAVQRFTGTEKFLSAVKEFMVEPSVRIVQKSGVDIQDVTKLVQVLAGDEPSIAIIPLNDEGGVWAAELYLVTGSILSEVEPGELNVSDEEDVVYGFLSFSPDTGDTFRGLRDGRMEVDTSLNFLDTRKNNHPEDGKSKKQVSPMGGDRETVDKRVQDLEEGQLVGEEQGVKEVVYERRKKGYPEEENKRGKVNGESEAKAKDKHSRHREHERDERGERGRRERDAGDYRDRDRDAGDYRDRDREAGDYRDRDREVGEYRDRDRDNLYSRRVYDYIPRLDKSRYREGDRRGDHRDMYWEVERRGSSKETPRERERERSRSKEREKEKLASLKDLSRAKSSSKLAPKPAPDMTKKRERSPLDSSRSMPKRLKDGSSRSYLDDRHEKNDLRTQNGDTNGDSRYHCSTVVQVSGTEVYCELALDVPDEETRSWLLSRQHAAYLQVFDVILTRATGMTNEDPLLLKLSTLIDETSDISEAEYFVHHAADIVKSVAQHGIFSKVLWYTGPVQQFSNEVAPAVHLVVKKLQGDLDKIQEATGVRMRVVLDADGKKSRGKTSLVGVELKGLKRKEIQEATQQVQGLFVQVVAFFAKPVAPVVEKPPPPVVVTKSKLLYVPGLPEYSSDRMVRAIFENAFKENPSELPPGLDPKEVVLDVKYMAEHSCAFVEFASDELLEAAFQLYINDKTGDNFCGLTVELPSPAALKLYQQVQMDTEDSKHDGDSEYDFGEPELNRPVNGASSRKNVKPLYLTELPRNATDETVKQLFEDIITTHITPSLSTPSMVLAVRHIPSRGCMFVDLATPELVEFMLDLHSRKPEVFGNMKMELGRNFLPSVSEERKRGYGSMDRSRSGRNFSPPRGRRRGEDEEYDEYQHEYGRSAAAKKQRSDPEKTVYADHLPENSSEAIIRKIFERVMFKHMTPEQRAQEVVTEVRHVRAKFCAFVVFGSEDLARLALELYNQDEDVFDLMRLKPHFNSRLEDMYREEGHERDEDAQSSRGSEDYHVEFQDIRGGRRSTATAGAVFKEVDRRRSVYVDRIPDKYDEVAIRDILDRFLRRKGRNSPSYTVSHVSFFRDKYDPSKLCAFVEVKHEAAVQELLDCYNDDEEAFDGMRIRPAVKYN